MKKFLFSLATATALIVLAACGGSGGDSPKDVAQKFFEAIKTFNIDEASKYATKDSKSMLDLMKMGMSFAPKNMDSIKNEMAKQKIEYSEPVINGEEATVSVTVDGKDKTDFKLKKEDGQWKVAFDKNSLMQTGMEKMKDGEPSEEDQQQMEDAMKQLNPDSLAENLKKAGEAIEEAGKAIDTLKQQ
jgi:nitrogen fixation protein FixH